MHLNQMKKIETIISNLLAISVIMNRFSLPRMLGIIIFTVGIWQRIGWLKIVGVILSLPIIWVYFVLMFVFFPSIIFDRIRQYMKQ